MTSHLNRRLMMAGAAATVPALAYVLVGFVNSDSQINATTGAPAISTTATAKSPVGQYSIAVAAGSLAAHNYSFKFVSGSMTVTKAALIATAGNPPVETEDILPAFTHSLTYSASGLIKGDSPASAAADAPALTPIPASPDDFDQAGDKDGEQQYRDISQSSPDANEPE